MKDVKRIRIGKSNCVRIETELGAINIFGGLKDADGRRTERIEIIPNSYIGEPKVINDGLRLIETDDLVK